ncbi:PREDICTED: uncharacterized protein LOC107356762 isoform X1 [Acropora digitifera]|uniref:uncharacterized protein LOC107356762 isoform X1 n=1 Tax=Acropora digitifera TaxID=70779 RepID=UPI00077B1E4B|nr:PREDICTED: uncharacterized protein LOC107356762 isoform X1 [Acropora digitifera]XP_015778870.1 PREDICTED: uncharacterized protein LOC107356762 isoform X1 [Acropora digitifera]
MKAYFSYLQGCKKGEDIFGLTPGLFDREFGDIVQTPKTENDDFKVLLCGRGDNEDFELKGYDIAVKAFADSRLKGKSYHLVFVGAPDGMQDEVRKRLLNHGITEEQLTVRKFVQSRSGIKELLCEVDLAIMPSKCEGYGLVALEALSAGLPVLVGSNSGFASAIRDLPLGASSIVDSDDPTKWAEAIERVCVRHGVCLKEIKMLRECYGKEYIWKTQCKALVERLWGMINDDRGTSISQSLAARVVMAQQDFIIPERTSRGGLRKFGVGRQDVGSEDQQSFREYGESAIDLLIGANNTLDEEEKELVKEMLTQLVQTCDDQSRDFRGLKSFNYNLIKTYKALVLNVSEGSIVVSLRCPTLESLEHLWSDYRSGDLDKLAERYLVTDDMKEKLKLEKSYLKITIDEENYLNCKRALMELPSTCSENPGKDLLHPPETTTTEKKRQNTDVPEKTFTAPDQAVAAVNLGEQGPSSLSELVSCPDATTIQHIVGYAVSSGRENVIQEERPRTYPLTTTEGIEGLDAGIPETDTGTVSSLIGILVDVSGSMRNNAGSEVNEERVSWARSIFKVVDELIKHDVESSNQTFALALGCPYEPQVFDLLGTARVATKVARRIKDLSSRKGLRELIDEALDILERNGAVRVRTWGKMDVLLKVLDKTTAAGILYYLQRRPNFTRRFVFECLPRECREVVVQPLNLLADLGFWTIGKVPVYNKPLQGWATESSVREAIDKGKKLMEEIRRGMLVAVREATIMSVQSASEILHNSIEEKNEEEIDEKRVDELLEAVEPFIYGGTPLIQAMRHSVDLFSYSQFTNHKKLLFILSDGQPTDGRDPPVQQLCALGVTVVCCFITREGLSDPRRLYSLLDESWEAPAKFMFNMSSIVTTQNIPHSVFMKRGWKIDIENNETRLFFNVNHPDVIKDVCDMARKAVLSQDVLSDLLASVDLDVYIKQVNDSFGVKRKQGGTSYANASAAVMHLAMKRIIGRDGGYPDFFELREKLIAKCGREGASTKEVLKEMCPEYRLQCQTVDATGAMKAISAKRPVVATFHLTGAQWDQFDKFYKENPRGILTRSYLDSKRYSESEPGGHAVVLTSYDADSLRLMNSWGDDWADQGFFRVQNSDVLGLKFVDVFWTLKDLSKKEKKAYEQHGAEVAGKLLKSLKGLQMVKYKCPLCAVESKVVDFTGRLLKAKCPACGGTFNANKEGGDLALNLYLMSLIHDDKSQ